MLISKDSIEGLCKHEQTPFQRNTDGSGSIEVLLTAPQHSSSLI